MHRESRIYRQIGHFLMPSSGNLVTKNKQLSRAVDLLRQASEEIARLTAELRAFRIELEERAIAHYGAVRGIQKQRAIVSSLKARLAEAREYSARLLAIIDLHIPRKSLAEDIRAAIDAGKDGE